MERMSPALLAVVAGLSLVPAGCADRMGGTGIGSPPPTGFTVPQRFIARGTEPFWAATVDGATLTYATPENQAGTRLPVTRQVLGESVVVRGLLASRKLILVVSPGPCSDGMSDIVYPYAVDRTLGEELQRGCAAPR